MVASEASLCILFCSGFACPLKSTVGFSPGSVFTFSEVGNFLMPLLTDDFLSSSLPKKLKNDFILSKKVDFGCLLSSGTFSPSFLPVGVSSCNSGVLFLSCSALLLASCFCLLSVCAFLVGIPVGCSISGSDS